MEIEVIKKNFDEIRRNKGLKIEDICADLGGITRQALYNYMKGGMSLNTLVKIAAVLGCDPWELLKPEPDQDNQDKQTEQPTQAANAIRCPHCNKIIFLNPTTTER